MTFYNQHSTALVGAAGQPQGHFLEDSLRLRSSASAYLNRTPTSTGNRKTWTWSGWVKRSKLNAFNPLFQANHSGVPWFVLGFANNDKIEVTQTAGSSASWESTAVFRDVSAWYHVVLVVDTTSATSTMAGSSTDRFRLYVNGVQYVITGGTVPTQNSDLQVNNTVAHTIGGYSTNMTDGYLTEVNFIDGQALDPSYFGETDVVTGVWKPAKYTGTYGTNGFYLPMTPTSQAEGFNTVLWKGNGATQSITGVGFAPDFVWIKSRTEGTTSYNGYNVVQDTVRGVGAALITDGTFSESGVPYSDAITAFNSDGFTLGARNQVNYNNSNFVAWCWDAGSGSPASNTDGSITSTVKANQAKGFSVVTYTGTGAAATVGHGLGIAPSMIIVKNRTGVYHWIVQHASLGATKYLTLSTTDASATSSASWNNTSPTSSVFSLGASSLSNQSSANFVAYCFSEVAGYSKIGSYTGNGSSSGPTITTGFRPAWVMIKRTDVADEWAITDNTRTPNNPTNLVLFANRTNAESGSHNIVSFSDTGFQVVGTPTWSNASGGTYIYMAFADTRDAQFNFDASGNKNNWTPNNINSNASGQSTYDLMKDVPTLTDADAGNFCTLNPIGQGSATLSSGNLGFSGVSSQGRTGTIGFSSGKWYWEVYVNTVGSLDNLSGIVNAAATAGVINGTAGGTQRYFYQANGNVQQNSGVQFVAATYTTGDTIGIAVDADSNSITWYKNNASQGSLSIDANIVYVPWSCQPNTSAGVLSYNFGQRPFAYTPPTGYKALNTYNLPDPTIKDGSDYFNTLLWTGDGTSSRNITGLAFQPDFSWLKSRSQARNHTLFDAVRTAGSNKALSSSTTDPEGLGSVAGASASFGYVSGFNSDGFSVSAGTTNAAYVNIASETYVAWNWKANGSGVSNTDGSITSTVSANTSSGFSIVSYTGQASSGTVGHGLGVVPELIIAKIRTNWGGEGWPVYSKYIGASNYLALNYTNAALPAAVWSNTTPTSSVFYVNGNDWANKSGSTMIAYCFAPIEGYSAFGKYAGNGSADGPFVYTGFRPAWLMLKRTDVANGWPVIDTKRDTYNVMGNYLYPNTSGAEATYYYADFTSNGFKLKATDAGVNASGGTYIYAAFAENPFKYSLAR